MAHPAVYIVTIGVAVGAALFAFFMSNPNRPQRQQAANKPHSFAIRDNHNNCSICQEQIKFEAKKTYLNCGHAFHTICISPWLSSKDDCPNCRCKVRFS